METEPVVIREDEVGSFDRIKEQVILAPVKAGTGVIGANWTDLLNLGAIGIKCERENR